MEIKRECKNCGITLPEENMLQIGEHFYCEECTFVCEECGCIESIDNSVMVHYGRNDTRCVCCNCAETSDRIFRCRDCEEYYSTNLRCEYVAAN